MSALWGVLLPRAPAVRCDQRPMERVLLRPNPLFDIIAAATAGAVAPARVRGYCAEVPDGGPDPEPEP